LGEDHSIIKSYFFIFSNIAHGHKKNLLIKASIGIAAMIEIMSVFDFAF
jgi:hypothetical protein